MRVAILDDYQQVALASADWSAVRELAEIDVFARHIARTEALVSALEPYDVVVAMRERTPFDAERLNQLPRLRLLVTTGMANASINLAAAAARGVTVCGTGAVGASTAELTWGLILALVRHIPEEDQRMKTAGRAGGAALPAGGGWQHTVGIDLHGKRLGVVGLGHQGRRVADIGRAFGMKVVAWSQNLDPDHAHKAHVKAVSKEELFASSDVVTVHYKLGPRSVGLVGAAELDLMKPSAYLVNTSRGPIVDSAALVAALRSGSIAGAALDVYDVEPLPLSSALRSAPNLVLTPHLGYVTEDAYRVFYGEAAEDIVAFAKGSPVRVLSALRFPPRIAAGQAQGAVERRRPVGDRDNGAEALVLAEHLGLGLDGSAVAAAPLTARAVPAAAAAISAGPLPASCVVICSPYLRRVSPYLRRVGARARQRRRDGAHRGPAAGGQAAAGTMRRLTGGRPRALSSAPRICAMTSAGRARICLGVNGSTTMPYLPIRACRSSVRSWSCGDMCHSRESTSTATPASGHHASGLATNVFPANSVALNSGIGRFDLASRSFRSPSAADLIPSATSDNASRNSADPTAGPAASSS